MMSRQPAVAYKDESVLMPFSERTANINAQTGFWSLCHMGECMAQCIIQEPRMPLPKTTKARAIAHAVPLITHSMIRAKNAPAQLSWRTGFPKTALLSWQRT